MEAKKQLDLQEFVSDEARIRENARNIDTYLRAGTTSRPGWKPRAMEAKKQLDLQEFVSDEARIRENARNRHLSQGSEQGNRSGNDSDTHPGSAG